MKIGKIISINYNQLKVKISSEIKGGSVNIRGTVYYFGNIGSYLKVTNAVEEIIICEVISIFDSDFHKDRLSFDIESERELLLKPVGTIDKQKQFTLGVGVFPSLYSDVSIVTFDDMKLILRVDEYVTKKQKNENIHDSFTLGTSKNLINYPIDLSIDNFFNIHVAVLGNTGSGKSNSIAHIIQEIHKKTDYSAIGSKLLMFDVNGEYSQALVKNTDSKISIRYYKPNIAKSEGIYEPFYLPHFLLTLDEWSAFLMATDATQRPFWDKVLQESYRFYQIGHSDDSKKFVGYLRYKICNMINSALRQADSDTSRITTANGILGTILSTIQIDDNLKHIAIDNELTDDIIELQKACDLFYGKNQNKLQESVDCVSEKINIDEVKTIIHNKIPSGEYFHHKFLKIATELTLLEEEARGNKQLRGFVGTMLIRLDYFLDNPNCRFMRETVNIKSVGEFLSHIWGNENERTQLVIIDTSELPPDILETLTSVVSRLLFEDRRSKTGDARRKEPIHLILDEAHRYIKKDYDYILKENIFEKIAREGRKFSIYLLISSQRPSELSDTVLSQCSNFIIHRIQNERDMHYIQAVLPYFSDDFTNKIKQSIPGEALVFGNCVSMPLHIKINKADPIPNSENCNIPEEWFKDTLQSTPHQESVPPTITHNKQSR